jgi:phosphatidylglycerophosphate synthase
MVVNLEAFATTIQSESPEPGTLNPEPSTLTFPRPVRSAATAQAIALLAVLGLGRMASAQWSLSPPYAVTAAAVLSVISALVLATVAHTHPFERFGPANHVTTARAAAAALFVGLTTEPALPAAWIPAACAALATGLDAADGWLARRSGMASAFGARFDMEIDALLILALAILVWRYDKAPAWVIASGLMRYLFAVMGRAWPWLRRPLPEAPRRKAIAVVQAVALCVAILPPVPRSIGTLLAACALAALCYSFLVDTLWLRKQADAS